MKNNITQGKSSFSFLLRHFDREQFTAMALEGSAGLKILIAVGLVGIFGIVTFALAAATLGTLNKQYDDLNRQIDALKQQIIGVDNKLTTTTLATPVTVTETTTAIPTTTTTTTAAATATAAAAAAVTSTGTAAITGTMDKATVST